MPVDAPARPRDAGTLERILGAFDRQPEAAGDALRRWMQCDSGQLAQLAVRHLGRTPAGPAERSLARFLASSGVAVPFLLNPAVVTGAEAIAAARILCETDFRFCRRLTDACDGVNTPEAIMRTFDIVVALNRVAVVVPWLQTMTRHRDARVQSKASLIFCRLYANPLLVERQLGSPDYRVQANAVEALWNIDTPFTRHILDKAASSPHHRVAVNALFGLYLLGAPRAAGRLIAMADRPSVRFRASAAWAMGRTGDPRFERCLRRLTSDPSEHVRRAAAVALHRLACSDPGSGRPEQVAPVAGR
ncbi:MAG TPA: HEAT repeat domain-containing protein [Bryobacteraceae bacterium]|nr:HEAT repeat domain-containing protein [Bryobacteraceae bacterium]